MILTDREIRLSLAEELISIVPAPGSSAYSSTSLDLRLDSTLTEFAEQEPGLELVVDPTAPGYTFNKAVRRVGTSTQIDLKQGFTLRKGILVLGWTKERVNLKSAARVAARVEGKSSLARLGLAVHVTAPTIHSGFDGQIQLEIINHGPLPIRLRADMAICQLIFEKTFGFPEKGYGGQFRGQASQ
jgi:dCTP deaminase